MKKLKITLFAIVALIAVLSPFVAITVFATAILPPQYSDTFVGALNDKYERLHSIEEDKIVVVGGSSVAFGLDSAKLEEYTGMPVVNFGLYAALGTKVMLDLSLDGIKEGDLVIISPELDPQTMSLYFSSETTLKALDDDFSMVWDIDHENWFSLLGGMWRFAGDKYERYQSTKDKPAVESTDIYQFKYFDEYLDFDYVRPENVMNEYYDVNTPVYLEQTIVGSQDFSDFADYLNKYIKKCEKKGAKVVFSYCPINSLAVVENAEGFTREDFDTAMREKIHCEFITDLDSMILDPGYFFDTNFHLNDAGVILRTVSLAYDIRASLSLTGQLIEERIPEPPALPGIDNIFEGEDENAAYFLYEELENGALAIVGLTELGKGKTELIIPLGAEGKKVTVMEGGALADSACRRLIVTEDSNLAAFRNGAFEGASNLKELIIYKTSGDKINPPLSFAGTADDFKVHIPQGSDFPTHYYWSERGLEFVEIV